MEERGPGIGSERPAVWATDKPGLQRLFMLETEMKVKPPDLTAPARRKDDREVTSGYSTVCPSKLQKAQEEPWPNWTESSMRRQTVLGKRRWSACACGVDRHTACECELYSSRFWRRRLPREVPSRLRQNFILPSDNELTELTFHRTQTSPSCTFENTTGFESKN